MILAITSPYSEHFSRHSCIVAQTQEYIHKNASQSSSPSAVNIMKYTVEVDTFVLQGLFRRSDSDSISDISDKKVVFRSIQVFARKDTDNKASRMSCI